MAKDHIKTVQAQWNNIRCQDQHNLALDAKNRILSLRSIRIRVFCIGSAMLQTSWQDTT